MSGIGRYAPSPTGPLHRGSLFAALGSYLHARAAGARWLLRIDDVDTPRVVAGADRHILETLIAFGLRWDGDVLYQSTRRPAYEQTIERLKHEGHAFDCGCTRRQAQAGTCGLEGPIYPGTCRDGLPPGRAARSVRLRVADVCIGCVDGVQGGYEQHVAEDIGDFVIRRADGVTAYQLATVLDDAYQQVTHIVRGADLLSSTPRQIYLQRCLGLSGPHYAHLPILVDAQGRKLGKSLGALALSERHLGTQLWDCLVLLGQQPPDSLRDSAVAPVLRWAIDNWSLAQVPPTREIRVDVYQRSSSQRPGLAQ